MFLFFLQTDGTDKQNPMRVWWWALCKNITTHHSLSIKV